MEIRKTRIEDLPRVMEIYAYARQFMAENGNPLQWGPTNWPPEELIRKDIADGDGYVCVAEDDNVIGAFFYKQCDDPTYAVIEEGDWKDDSPYGVVHRIAGDGSRPGIGSFCINWAFGQCGHLRMDTHGDNLVMRSLLEKLGFEKRGVIYVVEDDYPRYAYERI